MRFWVSVPVLSEQITEALPSVSTAGSLRTSAFFFAMRCTPSAITMVAVGTSLPELATAIVAAIKGNTQLALGNVIGSNIFNICLILGISSIVAPLDVTGLHPTDILAPLAAALMLLLSVYTFRGQRINRADGALFLALYIGYIAYLLLR